ncbi:MAG: hypothetical protein C0498_01285 [Anaerolinea sp.]|nr:hypothetical protein [Anaerolinea sp.]
MPTPTWAPAVAGGQAAADQLNQLLGTHPTQLVYEGSAVATGNTVAQASQYGSNGQYLAQPFVLATGTAVDRVRLWVADAGAGADVTVSLRANNAGNPSAASLASIVLPTEFVSGTARWVDLPLRASGLTNGATYWIVTTAAGDATNRALFGASGAAAPVLKTSTNGTTWGATATQLLHRVFAGATGLLVAASEDSGARWTELTYDGTGTLTDVREYVGVFRNTRTLTYSSGILTGVS